MLAPAYTGHRRVSKFVCLVLLLALATPARADDAPKCDPATDPVCHLAMGLEACDGEVRKAEAHNAALTRTLAACEARTCPPPAPVSPWGYVAAGGVGVAVVLAVMVLVR